MDEFTYSLVGQRYDSTGNEVGGAFVVNSSLFGAWVPSLALRDDGALVVSWTNFDTQDIEQKIITSFDPTAAAKDLTGGPGNDSFLGSELIDTLNGAGGDDRLAGLGGDEHDRGRAGQRYDRVQRRVGWDGHSDRVRLRRRPAGNLGRGFRPRVGRRRRCDFGDGRRCRLGVQRRRGRLLSSSTTMVPMPARSIGTKPAAAGRMRPSSPSCSALRRFFRPTSFWLENGAHAGGRHDSGSTVTIRNSPV